MFSLFIFLHHFSFKTPTLGGVLSENSEGFSAFEMLKGVKNKNQVFENLINVFE